MKIFVGLFAFSSAFGRFFDERADTAENIMLNTLRLCANSESGMTECAVKMSKNLERNYSQHYNCIIANGIADAEGRHTAQPRAGSLRAVCGPKSTKTIDFSSFAVKCESCESRCANEEEFATCVKDCMIIAHNSYDGFNIMVAAKLHGKGESGFYMHKTGVYYETRNKTECIAFRHFIEEEGSGVSL